MIRKLSKMKYYPKSIHLIGINFDTLEDLNKNSVKDLFSSHANLIIIIPEDFEAFSTVSSENQLTSKYVAGTKSIPNPEFNRLQMEMRSTEMKLKGLDTRTILFLSRTELRILFLGRSTFTRCKCCSSN